MSDQVGAPTWCREIARSTVSALQNLSESTGFDTFSSGLSGTYHMTASGSATWFDFARAICEVAAGAPDRLPWISEATSGRALAVQRILPIRTAEYPTPARRPPYSVLSNDRLFKVFGISLPDWRLQLNSAFTNLRST